ncbi:MULTISPECIES: fumarylacetoacetate hydrolase family protein [Thiomicrorhabdus]|uniref:Fumarylacetoacetate hydrolase family protein n=1 Tax=Thiomicrorhabdus heinhorstiae TaxID=2748010 RepID=A0ABS0C1F8_9GAMM|nr:MULTISPECIES: fumarylacetoacetate hydrolase family protein [Thiomicrorhabdus]MBF6059114.1 fumarylacetoacetate hydrolase family protein [Thiomicrorhabdus heinhorstiae]
MKEVIVDSRRIGPSKIVCIGRNFYAHIEELGNEIPDEMVFFIKPNSAISTSLRSFHQEPLHYEGELCFVFEEGRFSAVGFGLDLTKRQLQSKLKQKGLPWERAKAFDGSVVFSEFIGIEEISAGLSFELKRNGHLVQKADMPLMIHKPLEMLAEIQGFMTLQDGDIVMTGTPKGVGVIQSGDVFTASVKDFDAEIIQATWIAD